MVPCGQTGILRDGFLSQLTHLAYAACTCFFIVFVLVFVYRGVRTWNVALTNHLGRRLRSFRHPSSYSALLLFHSRKTRRSFPAERALSISHLTVREDAMVFMPIFVSLSRGLLGYSTRLIGHGRAEHHLLQPRICDRTDPPKRENVALYATRTGKLASAQS